MLNWRLSSGENVKSWLINRSRYVATGNTETHLVINMFWPIDFRVSIRLGAVFPEIDKQMPTGRVSQAWLSTSSSFDI